MSTGELPQPVQHFKPALSGQHDVKKHHVPCLLGREGKALFRPVGAPAGKAGFFQILREEPAQLNIVVYDEDSLHSPNLLFVHLPKRVSDFFPWEKPPRRGVTICYTP